MDISPANSKKDPLNHFKNKKRQFIVLFDIWAVNRFKSKALPISKFTTEDDDEYEVYNKFKIDHKTDEYLTLSDILLVAYSKSMDLSELKPPIYVLMACSSLVCL